MSTRLQALWIERRDARLFGVFHAATGTAKAAVLICPPFLHEHMRSHRLFALFADALSKVGFDVLRFDYSGSGDSEGVDEEFTLATATLDAATALSDLRRRNPGVRMCVLGVRAGAFVAAALASAGDADELWLWQPLTNGADYLAHLRRLDAFERSNPLRYRYAQARAHAAGDGSLMGFPCAPAMLAELAAARIEACSVAAADGIEFVAVGERSSFEHARRIDLPNVLGAWIDQIDMARVSGAPIDAVAAQVSALVGSR